MPSAGGSASAPSISPPNNISGAGGAIFNGGNLAVESSTFLTNSATVTTTGGGGAIANYVGSSLSVGRGTFTDNQAQQDGGAIFSDFFTLAAVSGSDFRHNVAISDTGGAVANLGVFTVTNSTFTANKGGPAFGNLQGGGGAIFSNNGSIIVLGPDGPNGTRGGAQTQAPQGLGPPPRLYVDHTRFISNSSEYEGGAIDGGVTAINASTFTSNTAAYGGAIDVLDNDFVISASTFIANAAINTSKTSAHQGGAIDSNGYQMRLVNSTFFGNVANAGAIGGAIQVESGAMWITNSTFLSNTAMSSGNGGAFSQNGNLIVHNVLIAFSVGGNCQLSMTLDAHDIDYPGTSCSLSGLHANPLALAPANNGGPTLTSALLPGSPAINAGDDAGCPGVDQRGAARPVGAHCDIGAFEFGGKVPWLWLPIIRK